MNTKQLQKINRIYNDITLNNNVEQYDLFYIKSHRSLQLMLKGHFYYTIIYFHPIE